MNRGNHDDSDCSYEPEYEWERVRIVRYEFHVQSLVPSPLEYMSMLHSQSKEISGRRVWCGSYLLSIALCQMHKHDETIFCGQRILELGTGTGLAGMVMSKMNPAGVVLTDGDEQAIALLKQNLRNPRNQIDPNVAVAAHLCWGKNDKSNEYFCKTCRVVLANKSVKFDVILAGDVLYKEELPQLFFETVQLYLADGGVLWLCHVPRAGVSQNVVIASAKKAGFTIEPYNNVYFRKGLNVDNQSPPQEDVNRAVLYRIRKIS